MTISFEASPELRAWLQEWSDEVPTLYFLDICAANAVKLAAEERRQDARKAELVNRLRSLDRPQNSFSYLLALIEKVNDTRSSMTDLELQAQIVADADAVRAFLSQATVIEHNDFLRGFARDLRGGPQELSQNAYLNILRLANDRFKLGNPVARARRLETAEAS